MKILSHNFFCQCFGEYDKPVVSLYFDIVCFSIDCSCRIARESPRCCCPYKQGGIRIVHKRQLHGHGNVWYVLVALCYFKVRQRRTTTRAQVHCFEAIIDKFAVIQVFKRPPHRLSVGCVHGLVVMVHICKTAHTRDDAAPFVRITKHRTSGSVVEFLYAVLFDVALVLDTELLLYLIFKRQTMTVPTPLPLDPIAAHRAVTRNSVFKSALENVAEVRQTGRERRPIIKNIVAFGRRFLKTLLIDMFPVPKGKDFFLTLGHRRFWNIGWHVTLFPALFYVIHHIEKLYTLTLY